MSAIQRPPMIPMVDHKPCLTAVDADVFAGDEAGLVRAEEEHHVGNVQRISDPSGGLLGGIRALVDGVVGVDPAGGDRIHPHPACQADGQGMGQRCDAALGCGVALRLGLAHPVAAGGNVDDAAAFGEVGREELRQIEGRGYPDLLGIFELLVGAPVDALEEGFGVVDEAVDVAVLRDDFGSEAFQRGLVRDVSHEIGVLLHVNHADFGACAGEFLADAAADALGAAGHDNDLCGESAFHIFSSDCV